MGYSVSNSQSHSATHFRNLLKYILIFGILGLSHSNPIYDVYNVRNEPEAIPMHLLQSSLQKIELPTNEIGSYNYGEPSGRASKRRHGSGSSRTSSNSQPESCCPTVIDVIEPTHGKNRAGDLVELYQSENVRQRFYENSCAPSISDRPCRYMERRHEGQSRCTQQYSYTYAMVKDNENDSSEWKLDYIQIRSGCSCHVASSP